MKAVGVLLGLGVAAIFLTLSGCNPSVEEIRSMTDQKELAKLALNASNSETRLAAAGAIQDQETLSQIIASSPYQDVRLTALKSLIDQDMLTKLVLKDSNPVIRERALAKITEQEDLAIIARTATHMKVRVAAMKRVQDPYVLAGIAVTESDIAAREYARREIVSRLHQLKQPKWLAVVAKAPDGKLIPEYVQRLLKEIPGDRKDCPSLKEALVDILQLTTGADLEKKYGDLTLRCDCSWSDAIYDKKGAAPIPLRQQKVRIQLTKKDGTVVFDETYIGEPPKNAAAPADGAPLRAPASINPYHIQAELLKK